MSISKEPLCFEKSRTRGMVGEPAEPVAHEGPACFPRASGQQFPWPFLVLCRGTESPE